MLKDRLVSPPFSSPKVLTASLGGFPASARKANPVPHDNGIIATANEREPSL